MDLVFTEIFADRAAVETKAALTQLDADSSRPSSEKKEIRKRLERLKIVVFTTPKNLDETVAFYEREVKGARFIFAVRNLEADLRDGIKSGAIKGDEAAIAKAAGQTAGRRGGTAPTAPSRSRSRTTSSIRGPERSSRRPSCW